MGTHVAGLLVMQTVDQALAGVVFPSGAGALTIGPQAMEGNLQIHPADTIKAGYDFTMPGAHAPAQVTVENASITMAVTCSNGATPPRSEEHTSELQSRSDLVCRLLLE